MARIAKRKDWWMYSKPGVKTNLGWFDCLHCGTPKKETNSSKNKYCNNKCQAEYRRQQKINDWLNGNSVTWKGTSIPAWAKNYIKQQNGEHCSICKITEHNHQPIEMQVDHIDGNPDNNLFENLRLLCPNCHSQQPTWGNRNKGNGRTSRKKTLDKLTHFS